MNKPATARQAQALAHLEQDVIMQAMIIREPAILHVMQIAAAQTKGGDRWFAYTALKNICEELVGWGAYHPDLRTSRYWERMMDALDELLPVVEEDDGQAADEYMSEIEQAYHDAISV